MKTICKVGIFVVGFALLGWSATWAGTDHGMDDKMGGQSQGMMDDASKGMMNDKMGAKDDAMGDGKAMMPAPEMHAREAVLKGSDGHHAAGAVTLGMGMNNRQVLTLSDIDVDEVPDGYVYLTKGGDRMNGVALGQLKQFSGSVSFDLPAGVNAGDYDGVVIWCKKFNVEIGRADFHGKAM